jgi:hypothetical protein
MEKFSQPYLLILQPGTSFLRFRCNQWKKFNTLKNIKIYNMTADDMKKSIRVITTDILPSTILQETRETIKTMTEMTET